MISVIATYSSYVDTLVAQPIGRGSMGCFSFIPSALFPKDSIKRYFCEHEMGSDTDDLTSKLWKHGRQHLRALKNGAARAVIEIGAVQRMVEKGRVHVGRPEYEIGFAERLHVLKEMRPLIVSGAMRVAYELAPYTFRLYPPNVILLDVTRNTTEQRVQGISIVDQASYDIFEAEFNRLSTQSITPAFMGRTTKYIETAIAGLTHGESASHPRVLKSGG